MEFQELVDTLLSDPSKHPYPLGGNHQNCTLIEKTNNAETTIIELPQNSIDAEIDRALQRNMINSHNAKTPEEHAKALRSLPNYDSTKRIQLNWRGNSRDRNDNQIGVTVEVWDKADGIPGDQWIHKILNLAGSTKANDPDSSGRYGVGASTAHYWSKGGIIFSRPKGSQTVYWTVIFKVEANEAMGDIEPYGNPRWFCFLDKATLVRGHKGRIVEGSVPGFDTPKIADRPENVDHFEVPSEFPTGTMVRHIQYQINDTMFGGSTHCFRTTLNEYHCDPFLEYSITDYRSNRPKRSKSNSHTRPIRGAISALRNTIKNDGINSISDDGTILYSNEDTYAFGQGKVRVLYGIIKSPKFLYRNYLSSAATMGKVLSAGQAHADVPKSLLRKKGKRDLSFLQNRMFMYIFLDELDSRDLHDIVNPSRESIKNSDCTKRLWELIDREILNANSGDSILHEYNEDFRTRGITDNKVSKGLKDRILDNCSKFLNPKSSPTSPHTRKRRGGKTTLPDPVPPENNPKKLVWKSSSHKAYAGQVVSLGFTTDIPVAAMDHSVTVTGPGKSDKTYLKWLGVDGHGQIKNIIINQGAKVGDQIFLVLSDKKTGLETTLCIHVIEKPASKGGSTKKRQNIEINFINEDDDLCAIKNLTEDSVGHIDDDGDTIRLSICKHNKHCVETLEKVLAKDGNVSNSQENQEQYESAFWNFYAEHMSLPMVSYYLGEGRDPEVTFQDPEDSSRTRRLLDERLAGACEVVTSTFYNGRYALVKDYADLS